MGAVRGALGPRPVWQKTAQSKTLRTASSSDPLLLREEWCQRAGSAASGAESPSNLPQTMFPTDFSQLRLCAVPAIQPTAVVRSWLLGRTIEIGTGLLALAARRLRPINAVVCRRH